MGTLLAGPVAAFPLPSRIQAGVEPIPGYRLLQRLGVGAFGEVWKAEAPGGLPKAIKFVRGLAADGGPATAALVRQELAALQRVQAIRHPFLLSLERYDVVDGCLVVVMELADQNLWQRRTECVRQGLPGIPRFELLRYVREAAEALDLMNQQHGLHHLDVKPENLFLIHHHVKVADFGLVQDRATAGDEVGGTPAYAAPEIFCGRIRASTDQYSLAVVFQELLTGKRPFPGPAAAYRDQHLRAAPDLSPLPEADRPVIARALAKLPESRFPSCRDLVRALVEATGKPSTVGGRAETSPASGSCQLEIPDEIGLVPVEELPAARPPSPRPSEVALPAVVLVEANCPTCGFEGHVPEKFAGRKLRCRACSGQFRAAGAPAEHRAEARTPPRPATPRQEHGRCDRRSPNR